MRRCFTFTLGFREDIPLRRLHQYSATPRDEIIIVAPHPVPLATRRCIESLELMLAKLALPQPEVIEAPLTIPEAAARIAQALTPRSTALHVVDLSQGPRSLVIAAYTAVIKLGLEAAIHVEAEGDEAWHTTIPPEVTKNITRTLPPAQAQALRILLATPGLRLPELAAAMSKAEKTVQNIVAQLKKKHLLQTRRGRLYPTPWARLFTT